MKIFLLSVIATALAIAQECPRTKTLKGRTIVSDLFGTAPGATAIVNASEVSGTIDKQLFQAMEKAGVKPAPLASDEEFLRRVSLDMTGRIPLRIRIDAFAADTRIDKRDRLVDELLASPEWVDKWTMYFGDLLQNSVNFGRQRYPQERDAMYRWIKSSLQANKAYDQMAREMIRAKGESSWEDGRLGFLTWAGLLIQLEQDRMDLQAVHVADAFLGLSHVDCLLCHNGRGHLTDISLLGRQTTRRQAWEFAAFFGKTTMALGTGGATAMGPRPSPWYLRDEAAKTGYLLNTTAGDRPARTGDSVVTPRYLTNGNAAREGEVPRSALAREVTADMQFARAAVNYIWKEFFVLGIVEPTNQFDLARLDPDNPPPDPWKLQPTNARLLNQMARDFIDSGFDLKALMSSIAKSKAYQLSSRYEGEWKAEYEALFARKFVRRLWAEEIHDAIAQASGIPSTYIAMKLPGGAAAGGPGGNPAGGASSDPLAAFIDSFLRGNRVDQPRSGDFSLDQALRLMNNAFVLDRISVSELKLRQSDDLLAEDLYLSVLGRRPDAVEKATSIALLQEGSRSRQASHLIWSLINKADFIYNY